MRSVSQENMIAAITTAETFYYAEEQETNNLKERHKTLLNKINKVKAKVDSREEALQKQFNKAAVKICKFQKGDVVFIDEEHNPRPAVREYKVIEIIGDFKINPSDCKGISSFAFDIVLSPLAKNGRFDKRIKQIIKIQVKRTGNHSYEIDDPNMQTLNFLRHEEGDLYARSEI